MNSYVMFHFILLYLLNLKSLPKGKVVHGLWVMCNARKTSCEGESVNNKNDSTDVRVNAHARVTRTPICFTSQRLSQKKIRKCVSKDHAK